MLQTLGRQVPHTALRLVPPAGSSMSDAFLYMHYRASARPSGHRHSQGAPQQFWLTAQTRPYSALNPVPPVLAKTFWAHSTGQAVLCIESDIACFGQECPAVPGQMYPGNWSGGNLCSLVSVGTNHR